MATAADTTIAGQPSCASRTVRGADNSPNSRSPVRPPPGRRTTRNPPRGRAQTIAHLTRRKHSRRRSRARTGQGRRRLRQPAKYHPRGHHVDRPPALARGEGLRPLCSIRRVRPTPSFAALLASNERNRRLGPSQQLASDHAGSKRPAWTWSCFGTSISTPRPSRAGTSPAGLGAFARWQHGKTVERISEDLDAWRRHGLPISRPAVADDPRLLEFIRQLRDDGSRLRQIANELNVHGILTLRGGATWRASSVQTALGYRRSRRDRRSSLLPPRRPSP